MGRRRAWGVRTGHDDGAVVGDAQEEVFLQGVVVLHGVVGFRVIVMEDLGRGVGFELGLGGGREGREGVRTPCHIHGQSKPNSNKNRTPHLGPVDVGGADGGEGEAGLRQVRLRLELALVPRLGVHRVAL